MQPVVLGSALVVAAALVSACSSSIADQPAESPVPVPAHALRIEPGRAPQIPAAVRAEHEQIHAALIEATKALGPVGDAARELAGVLHPHFVREEQIALPPLGLLAALAAGEYSPEMQSVLPMTEALRQEMPQLLREHASIVAATQRLQQASAQAGDRQAEALARQLLAHAESEEEIYYPAALLVGEVVRSRSRHGGRPTAAR